MTFYQHSHRVPKIDITRIEEHNDGLGTMKFTLSETDTSIANAVRRIIM